MATPYNSKQECEQAIAAAGLRFATAHFYGPSYAPVFGLPRGGWYAQKAFSKAGQCAF